MNTSADNLEMIKKMASDGYESARQLGDINLRAWNNISEKQTGMFDIWLEVGTKQIELNTVANEPEEYLRAQMALNQDMGAKLMASLRDVVYTGRELQGEYRAWFDKSVQSMAGNWNTVGKQFS